MTIEELKQHCIRTIKMSEAIESMPNVKITDKRGLQEHKMVLKLIEAIQKIKDEIEQRCHITVNSNNEPAMTLYDIFSIIDKYLKEVEK